MKVKDYYTILCVEKGASEEEIKSSYRHLALEYHPDTNKGNPEKEERFKEINEAYAILGDRDKRRQYDSYGLEGGEDHGYYDNQFEEWYSGNQGFNGTFGRPGRGMGLWQAFAPRRPHRGASRGCGRAGCSSTPPAIELSINLSEARTGAEKTVPFSVGNHIRRLKVKVPAGVKNGQILSLKGKAVGNGRQDIFFRIVII